MIRSTGLETVDTVLHSAPLLFPMTHEPIPDGAIAVRGDRVVAAGRRAEIRAAHPDCPERCWPGILLPGLVNAHTHLEFTALASLGKQKFDGFEDWSTEFDRSHALEESRISWADSARNGFAMSLESGTTRVADVVSSQSTLDSWLRGEFSGRGYLELLGDDAASWTATKRDWLAERFDKLRTQADIGISPHAPYTVGTAALQDMFTLAAQQGMRVHLHVAEARAENELVHDGAGSLAELVRQLNIDLELLRSAGCGRSSTDYIDNLGGLGPATHLAHGVFLDSADRALLRDRSTAVALCPRSNAAVGSGAPPIAALLAEGNQIAIGTDSLASSPSLDLMDDVGTLRDLARLQGYHAPDLERRLVEAATLGGARAVGFDGGRPAGLLCEGSRADFTVFNVHVPQSQDPYRAFVDRAPGRCVATAVDGVVVYDAVGDPGSDADV